MIEVSLWQSRQAFCTAKAIPLMKVNSELRIGISRIVLDMNRVIQWSICGIVCCRGKEKRSLAKVMRKLAIDELQAGLSSRSKGNIGNMESAERRHCRSEGYRVSNERYLR